MNEKTKHTDFDVRGRGAFPFDMLRHDQCWPTNSNDAVVLDDFSCERTVHLRTWHERNITPGRWESFGWNIVEKRHG